jgi:hypothetical protein
LKGALPRLDCQMLPGSGRVGNAQRPHERKSKMFR